MSSYDVIAVGSGAGGGTNWQSHDVFVDSRYVSKDTWYDVVDTSFFPSIGAVNPAPPPA
jgi:hypothetical protein